MAGKEQQPTPFGLLVPESERAEILAIPHSELLHNAFDALAHQLDNQGYTGRFGHLIQVHSRKILQYWAALKDEYDSRSTRNGEKIYIDGKQVYALGMDTNRPTSNRMLQIRMEGPLETAHFTLNADTSSGIDEYTNPPVIHSSVFDSPGGIPEFKYEVTFRNRAIDKITRSQRRFAMAALVEGGGFIMDSRTIDRSQPGEFR